MQAISVLTVTSFVGSTRGDTATLKHLSSIVRWSVVKAVLDLFITHLLLSILFSFDCVCFLACLNRDKFGEFIKLFIFYGLENAAASAL